MFNFLFGEKKRRRKVSKKKVKKPKRKMRFGMPGVFNNNSGTGYNKDAQQTPSIVPQSPNFVTEQSNISRPSKLMIGGEMRNMQLGEEYIPTYGTGARFFNAMIPKPVGPDWNKLNQPRGMPPVMVGSPFYGYGTPSFGRRKRRVRKTRKTRKPIPKKILRLCKKLKIKTTVKRGSKRVYKKLSVLKKQIKMKMKKVR